MSARRVLVVEDEAHVRFTLARMLSLSGYEVLEAGSGEEAVAIARHTAIHLVVSDIRLPGMDGFQAFQEVRRLQTGVCGVAMTGYADPDAVDSAAAAGFDCLLRKPFPFEVLLKAVRAALPPTQDTAATE